MHFAERIAWRVVLTTFRNVHRLIFLFLPIECQEWIVLLRLNSRYKILTDAGVGTCEKIAFFSQEDYPSEEYGRLNVSVQRRMGHRGNSVNLQLFLNA